MPEIIHWPESQRGPTSQNGLERLNGLDCLAGLDGPAVLLCATHRLTRQLRLAHGRAQAAAGRVRWAALDTVTVARWCASVLDQALLSGELPAELAPRLLLSATQERLLWEAAIAAGGGPAGEAGFYDRRGLAEAAMEANALAEAWKLRLPGSAGGKNGGGAGGGGEGLDGGPDEGASEETRHFLGWRGVFRQQCDERGWIEPVRGLDWQIDAIARGAGRLPAVVAFVGYVAPGRLPPQEARLASVLAGRGVRVVELRLERDEAAPAEVLALPDRVAECRAAVAWAARQIAAASALPPTSSPSSLSPSLPSPYTGRAVRLGIVVPELAALRDTLADLLDAALLPAAFDPAQAGMARPYDFSLGRPLAREPLVATALELLQLAGAGRSGGSGQGQRIEQSRLGELLRGAYWSSEDEADDRHRLEALMRERLAPELSLGRLLSLARHAASRGITVPCLIRHIEALHGWTPPARQLPSRWAAAIVALLAAAGWPGDRPLSSQEWQVRRAFLDVVDSLGQLDAVLGKVGASGAASRLRELCGERIFQPEAAGDERVTVMGLLEAVAEPFDALWVMGMNDHLWPPAPRPNPLLPAELQRRAGTPNAAAEVQLEFARAVQGRLLRGAAQVVFSHAQSESGRGLRASPLLAGLPSGDPLAIETGPGLIGALAGAATESLADSRAPDVATGEKVRGGTGLLKAQAVCPAWAFYQYRLGARALAEPVEGLDAMGRGTLLHAVLERFWAGRGSAELAAMNEAQRLVAIGEAVAAGIADFNGGREEPLPPRFLALEGERLTRLVGQWLAVEARRPAAFSVVACEREITLDIEGIAVRLVVDRIDALDDGRWLILDYKTGGKISAASWGEERISEPQLPIYAALAAGSSEDAAAAVEIAGAAFARVRPGPGECGFVGIAAEGGLLPKVAGIGEDAARKLFPALTNWPQLLAHWRESIAAIAREVREGCAAVVFKDEQALEYCEVKPLLRLAERATEFSRGESAEGRAA